MIVRDDGASLILITQPDHAALAADLMRAWCADGLPERPTRLAALFAVEHHDIGWTSFDEEPLVDAGTGRPSDFISAPVPIKQAVWRRAVDVLPERSTYAAALVAQHALTIYRRHRGDPAWDAFFTEMEAARDRWFTTDVRPDGGSGGVLDPGTALRGSFLQDYASVGTGDLLSLVFCNRWTAPHTAERYNVRLAGSELRVEPDPFDGRPVPFRVRARRVPNRPYGSAADLRAALSAATDVFLEGIAVGVPGQDAT